MSTIINPIIRNHNFFQSTGSRVLNLFTPIQSTDDKESDVAAYLLTPVIDVFILEPVFAIDASIHLLNAVASVFNAAYIWTQSQQQSSYLLDYKTTSEVDEAVDHFYSCYSALAAQFLNSILSILALVTRPLVSVIEAIADASSTPSQEKFDRYQPSFNEEVDADQLSF